MKHLMRLEPPRPLKPVRAVMFGVVVLGAVMFGAVMLASPSRCRATF